MCEINKDDIWMSLWELNTHWGTKFETFQEMRDRIKALIDSTPVHPQSMGCTSASVAAAAADHLLQHYDGRRKQYTTAQLTVTGKYPEKQTKALHDAIARTFGFQWKTDKDREDYAALYNVLTRALHQAAYGKGRERHANDKAFVDQPILEMARLLDSPDGLAQQVMKKVLEARGLPTVEARVRELLGAVVYTAAMVIWEEEKAAEHE